MQNEKYCFKESKLVSKGFLKRKEISLTKRESDFKKWRKIIEKTKKPLYGRSKQHVRSNEYVKIKINCQNLPWEYKQTLMHSNDL